MVRDVTEASARVLNCYNHKDSKEDSKEKG